VSHASPASPFKIRRPSRTALADAVGNVTGRPLVLRHHFSTVVLVAGDMTTSFRRRSSKASATPIDICRGENTPSIADGVEQVSVIACLGAGSSPVLPLSSSICETPSCGPEGRQLVHPPSPRDRIRDLPAACP